MYVHYMYINQHISNDLYKCNLHYYWCTISTVYLETEYTVSQGREKIQQHPLWEKITDRPNPLHVTEAKNSSFICINGCVCEVRLWEERHYLYLHYSVAITWEYVIIKGVCFDYLH